MVNSIDQFLIDKGEDFPHRHLMLDIETMGANPRAPVCQIGALWWEPATGRFSQEGLEVNVDLLDDMGAGAEADGETIYWWLRQAGKARAGITAHPRHTGHQAMELLNAYLATCEDRAHMRVWAWSPTFDCTIMRELWKRHSEVAFPWRYWNEYDCRTVWNLLPRKERDKVEKNVEGVVSAYGLVVHNGLADCLQQAIQIFSTLDYLKIEID